MENKNTRSGQNADNRLWMIFNAASIGFMILLCLAIVGKHGLEGDIPGKLVAILVFTAVVLGGIWLMRKVEGRQLSQAANRSSASPHSTPSDNMHNQCLRCLGTGIDQANGGNCPACGKRGWSE